MATIVYLDADDEITSAASRIRTAGDGRVGLVLPFGSRVATSRINFRLLAREAQANGRRLDIVAPDAAARALAASAGLAVFASVGEYEAALDADEDASVTRPVAGGMGVAARDAGPVGAAGSMGAAGAVGTSADAPTASYPVAGDGRPIDPSRDTVPTQRVRAPITEPASGDYGAPGIAAVQGRPEPRVDSRGVRSDRRRGGPGRGVLVLLLAFVAVAAAGAWAALNVLPTAEVTVTPRYEAIEPISFTVTADPDVTAVDPDSGTIPATTIDIPVSASGEFPATGKKVVKEKASGAVRFTNCDPSASYSIPSGTVVSTRNGTGFAIRETVFLPVAVIAGAPPNIQVRCTTSEVAVTAVKSGTDGNVGAGDIRVVPARYNRNLVRVTNPSATSGGTREVFPKVSQEDVDAALAQLKVDAQAQFEAALEDPASVSANTTVFPETGVLGDLTADTDPATLVDQEVETFTLGVTGAGTVQAVDASPIQAIAEDRLSGAVGDGYELVPGTTTAQVGEGSVVDGLITFPVDATARQLRFFEGSELTAGILGLSRAEAEARLAQYGDVVIVLWPDFIETVPSSEARVHLTIGDPVDPDGGQPAATATPGATAAPAAEPSGAPADDVSSEPVPSG